MTSYIALCIIVSLLTLLTASPCIISSVAQCFWVSCVYCSCSFSDSYVGFLLGYSITHHFVWLGSSLLICYLGSLFCWNILSPGHIGSHWKSSANDGDYSRIIHFKFYGDVFNPQRSKSTSVVTVTVYTFWKINCSLVAWG